MISREDNEERRHLKKQSKVFSSKEVNEAGESFWSNDHSEENSYLSQRNTKPLYNI